MSHSGPGARASSNPHPTRPGSAQAANRTLDRCSCDQSLNRPRTTKAMSALSQPAARPSESHRTYESGSHDRRLRASVNTDAGRMGSQPPKTASAAIPDFDPSRMYHLRFPAQGR